MVLFFSIFKYLSVFSVSCQVTRVHHKHHHHITRSFIAHHPTLQPIIFRAINQPNQNQPKQGEQVDYSQNLQIEHLDDDRQTGRCHPSWHRHRSHRALPHPSSQYYQSAAQSSQPSIHKMQQHDIAAPPRPPKAKRTRQPPIPTRSIEKGGHGERPTQNGRTALRQGRRQHVQGGITGLHGIHGQCRYSK